MKTTTVHSPVIVLLAGAILAFAAAAQESVSQEEFPAPERNYSPYVGQNFPNRVFWGDTHLHTSFSVDAGMVGCKLGPEEAYRYARGEQVISSTGQRVKMSRPYDFLVVTDHAENLGLAPMIAISDPILLKNPVGKRWHDLVKSGKGFAAFLEWNNASGEGKDLINSSDMMRSAWEYIIKAAEKYNEPGRFTAFIGYEWTSMPGGNNLHRNIIFRDGGQLASRVLPFSAYDSPDPEKLWQWMQTYEDKTGGRLLAIPHNGNLSNGRMFAVETMSGKPLDRAYAETRARREPVVEVTQPKGTGEAHRALSPDDEFANFEIWDKVNLGGFEKTTKEMLPGSYARAALKAGLALEEQLGANPFKFGLVGSTDSHTGLSTAEEDNYFGKMAFVEPGPHRWDHDAIKLRTDPSVVVKAWELGASGLAAVWGRENTRESLFDALERKEVYGTTGTRMIVRLFAGWDFEADDVARPNFAAEGYRRGVPMGGDLRDAPAGKAPTFVIRALRDVEGANLDRIQVIKGWLDVNGEQRERIYDVAVSDGRSIDAEGRCKTPVGNTVDVPNATYKNTIGVPLLSAFWKDPNFNPKERAFYYVRVIEIPTPRWTAFDAKFYGIKMPDYVTMTLQERAYTSPVWYTPGKG